MCHVLLNGCHMSCVTYHYYYYIYIYFLQCVETSQYLLLSSLAEFLVCVLEYTALSSQLNKMGCMEGFNELTFMYLLECTLQNGVLYKAGRKA